MPRVADANRRAQNEAVSPRTRIRTFNIVPDLARLAFPVNRLTPLPGNPRKGDGLMRSRALSFRSFGPERSRAGRPVNLSGFKVGEQKQPRLLLLSRQSASSRLADPIGRGDQQPI